MGAPFLASFAREVGIPTENTQSIERDSILPTVRAVRWITKSSISFAPPPLLSTYLQRLPPRRQKPPHFLARNSLRKSECAHHRTRRVLHVLRRKGGLSRPLRFLRCPATRLSRPHRSAVQ